MSDMNNEFEIIFSDIDEIYGKMALVLSGCVKVILAEHLVGNSISEKGVTAIARILDMYNLHDCSIDDCFNEYDALEYSAIVLTEIISILMDARLAGNTDSIKGMSNIYEMLEIVRNYHEWFEYESELLSEEGSDENDSE